MKVVVVGGTGRIGARLVGLLTERGHEAVAASPRTGVDTLTGVGLEAALTGAGVVVDVSNAPFFDPAEVLDFFRRSGEHLLRAEQALGVRHHVALSIVGVDRLPGSGYMRAKIAQEELITASGVPFTIVRATQFFEFLGAIAAGVTVDGVVHGSPALIQPIAAGDVAAALAEIAVEPPAGVVELAGPAAAPISETLRRFLAATGDDRKVVEDPAADYFGARLQERSLVPAGGALLGATTLGEWLAQAEDVAQAGDLDRLAHRG